VQVTKKIALEKNSNKERSKKENIAYKIPVKGSLGLLAYGHHGLREWRKVRDSKQHNSSKK